MITLFLSLGIPLKGNPAPNHSPSFMEERAEDNSLKGEDFAFTDREFEYAKRESIYFMSRFNDGWLFITTLFHIENNLLNKWAIYTLIVEPDGTSHWVDHKIKPSDVKFEKDHLFISDGANTIKGRGGFYSIEYRMRDFSCNLNFKNILAPWKAGDGTEYLDKEGKIFEKRVVVSPWSEVSGYIKFNNRVLPVKGQGFGEKSLIVNPLTKIQPYMHSLKVFSSEDIPLDQRWYINLLDYFSHPEYDSKHLGRLFIGHKGQLVLNTSEYRLEVSDFIKDDNIPYEYPRSVSLFVSGEGYILEGEFKSEVLFNFTDVLKKIPFLLRPIVLLFVDRPIYFRSIGEFRGRIIGPDSEITPLLLSGSYEYVVVK
ncbi:MAG: hypothetical protein DRP87_10375 [Spirochaetes bacterium]|nr:MAG: hypothetical protein DRP87_10375 [Spirochaetota bacterium]